MKNSRRDGKQMTSEGKNIPKVIHFFWTGPHAPTQNFRDWARCNPGWAVRVWSDEQVLREFGQTPNVQAIYTQTRKPNQKSDVARVEILHRHGGVYVDADILSLAPLDRAVPQLATMGCVLVQEKKRLLSNSFMAAVPGHPVLRACRTQMRADVDSPVWKVTGPGFITDTLVREGMVVTDPATHGFGFRSTRNDLHVLPHSTVNLGADFRHSFWDVDLEAFLRQASSQERNRDFRFLQRCGVDSLRHVLGWQIFLGGKAARYQQFNGMSLDALKAKAQGYIRVVSELVNKDRK